MHASWWQRLELEVPRWLAALREGLARRATPRNLLAALALLIVADWCTTGIRAVREDEQAVVLQFGRVVRVAPAGLLFHLPWPIERSVVFRTREVRTMPIGFKLTDAVRGIPPDPKEVEWVTGDTNIINITMTLKYAVSDPVKYLVRVGPVDADFLVRRAAESVITELVATMPVDELLTSGKALVQEETRLRAQALLDSLEAGLRLVTVNIGSVDPPATVIEAFNDVATAKLEKARMINQADGYQRDLLPRARAMAERKVRDAESYSAATVEGARGRSAQYLDLLGEARKAREITETRLYLEAMERILPRARMIVAEERSGNAIRIAD
jgi:modulator of FtsH protease HflK